MSERLVFWCEGCAVYSGKVLMYGRGGGWSKIHGSSKVYDTLDTPDEAKRVAFDLNMTIGSALS